MNWQKSQKISVLKRTRALIDGKRSEKPLFYRFAHQTLIEINEMKPQFEDLDSSLDDTAADYIAEAMMMIVQEAGYLEIEMEELIANREW